MLTEADIRQALRDCYTAAHPYTRPINLVDLGLVAAIALNLDPEAPGAGIPGVPPRHRLVLTLLAATPDRESQSQLAALIQNRMAGLPQLSRTEVRFALTPSWTPARLTPAGRSLLQIDFPILNNR